MSPTLRNAVGTFLVAMAVDVSLRGRSPIHLEIAAVLGVIAGGVTYLGERRRVHPGGAPQP